MALFALLVQFAVSFGHVHGEHARIEAPVASVPAGQSAPDQDHADPACAICIVNQMLGTAQTAAPPAVRAALISHATEETLISERVAAPPPSSAFRSRAPPLA